MKPLVYVAGPISSDPAQHAHDACHHANRLIDEDLVVPFIPQLSVFWQIVTPRSYESWLAYDFDILDHCQALLRLPGDSPGADREIEYCCNRGIPVFYTVEDLYDWVAETYLQGPCCYPGLECPSCEARLLSG